MDPHNPIIPHNHAQRVEYEKPVTATQALACVLAVILFCFAVNYEQLPAAFSAVLASIDSAIARVL